MINWITKDRSVRTSPTTAARCDVPGAVVDRAGAMVPGVADLFGGHVRRILGGSASGLGRCLLPRIGSVGFCALSVADGQLGGGAACGGLVYVQSRDASSP